MSGLIRLAAALLLAASLHAATARAADTVAGSVPSAKTLYVDGA